MPGDIRNTFISHIHEDDDGLQDLKTLLGNNGLQIRDASITSDIPNNATNEEYIKREILAPRINWASVLIVYITSQTKESEYVDWEIEYAHRNGKHNIVSASTSIRPCAQDPVSNVGCISYFGLASSERAIAVERIWGETKVTGHDV